MNTNLVIVETPYAGDDPLSVAENTLYAQRAMKDCLDRGEAPFLSHLLYTQVLDDKDADQRRQGIEAGLAWGGCAHRTVVYTDFGISEGMKQGIDRATTEGRPVEFRILLGANNEN